MEPKTAAAIFEALASEIRLAVFRLLARNAPDGLVAGDISGQLSIPKSNLSFHLKNMEQSGLVSMTREGRNMRYKANITLMLEAIDYITDGCRPENKEQRPLLRKTASVPPELL
ncbi:MAG: metalloregulator ArsR/SmtB family transcription factor [Desulfovibrio sp.]|jgi:DNA-binding transcriptional ArsR family regulator|nr:metalloregulator ArsR/SmtB family transcription factor [Desulfovibrio sp.]